MPVSVPPPDPDSGAAARRLTGRLVALVRCDWPDREDREELLGQVNGHCSDLHDLVTATYFDYPLRAHPPTLTPRQSGRDLTLTTAPNE